MGCYKEKLNSYYWLCLSDKLVFEKKIWFLECKKIYWVEDFYVNWY